MALGFCDALYAGDAKEAEKILGRHLKWDRQAIWPVDPIPSYLQHIYANFVLSLFSHLFCVFTFDRFHFFSIYYIIDRIYDVIF